MKSLDSVGHYPLPVNVVQLADRVQVTIRSVLGFDTWKAIRDGRELALTHNLPLHLDLSDCPDAHMGGVGTLLIAHERLGHFRIDGCSDHLARSFSILGICDRCGSGDHSGCNDRSACLSLSPAF